MARVTRVTGRRARQRRDRRQRFGVLAAAVAAGLVAGVGATRPDDATSAHALTPSTTAPVTTATPTERPARTILFAHVGPNDTADEIGLIAIAAGGRRASWVTVPPATVVEVPSMDLAPLSVLVATGGASMLALAVENALGVRVDQTVALDDAALERLLGAARPLTVTLAHAVRLDAGDLTISLGAGRQTIAATTARGVLTGADAAGGLQHLVTEQAVWTGWLAALATEPAAAARARSAVPALAPLIGAAAGVGFVPLPVESVDAADEERFQIRDGALAKALRPAFDFARLGIAGRRPRVEILNGVGTAGVTPGVAQLVVPAGGDVRLTGNVAGFGVATTRVVYYRDVDAAAATALTRALGVGAVVKGEPPVDIVDITIVIGQDLANRLAASQPSQ